MIINKVFVLNYDETELKIKKLPFENNKLRILSELVKTPSENRMRDLNTIPEGEFISPGRYYINKNDEQKDALNDLSFQVMDKIVSKTNDKIGFLNNMSEMYDEEGKGNNLQYDIIIYECVNEGKERNEYDYYFFEIKNSLRVKGKIGLFGVEKKAGTTNANLLDISKKMDGFYFPLEACICRFSKTINILKSDENCTLKVYRALEFNQMFKLNDAIEKIAENTVNRFSAKENNLTLTSDNLRVSFPQSNNIIDPTFLQKIKSSSILSDSLARFKGTKASKIQKINSLKLKEVLERLRKYADSDPSAEFDAINVPIIDEQNNVINVNAEQIGVFSGLIENKVIERILNGKIEVPYYKKR